MRRLEGYNLVEGEGVCDYLPPEEKREWVRVTEIMEVQEVNL